MHRSARIFFEYSHFFALLFCAPLSALPFTLPFTFCARGYAWFFDFSAVCFPGFACADVFAALYSLLCGHLAAAFVFCI